LGCGSIFLANARSVSIFGLLAAFILKKFSGVCAGAQSVFQKKDNMKPNGRWNSCGFDAIDGIHGARSL
jgi:hypothetical protein